MKYENKIKWIIKIMKMKWKKIMKKKKKKKKKNNNNEIIIIMK